MSRERYKGWSIEYNPKPIPDRGFDYDYWSDDYDGENDLSGSTSSVKEAKLEIDELELLEGR
jgi:hypothetical protein